MPVKLLTSGGGGVNLIPSSSIASDQTMYLPTSGTSGGTVLCTDSTGGTANGVLYLNGSKQVTSGSGLVFDSSGNLGLGVTPSAWYSSFKAIDIGLGGAVFGSSFGSQLLGNCYINSSFQVIGKGQSNYTNRFVVASDIGAFIWSGASSGTGVVTEVERMRLDSSGNLTISGSTATKASGTTWANPSDQRLKDNIRDYEKGLVELMQVRVREWEYNGKGGTTEGLKGLGVVADEIEKILPNTVETYEAKLEETDEEVTTIKKFDATEITWLLVNAVKELTQRIEALEYTKQGE